MRTASLVLLNKPFQVLCQFRKNDDRATLADFVSDASLRIAGRLDYDSEGLVVLTSDGQLAHRIAHPDFYKEKTYLVQVEGEITPEALKQLASGVDLKDGRTRPASVCRTDAPDIWPRVPPIRERRHIPVSWLKITISEGKNRQVRRMTAAVGFPTLRLIRWSVGDWTLDGLSPGETRVTETEVPVINDRPKKTGDKHRLSGSKRQIRPSSDPRQRHNRSRHNRSRTD